MMIANGFEIIFWILLSIGSDMHCQLITVFGKVKNKITLVKTRKKLKISLFFIFTFVSHITYTYLHIKWRKGLCSILSLLKCRAVWCSKKPGKNEQSWQILRLFWLPMFLYVLLYSFRMPVKYVFFLTN